MIIMYENLTDKNTSIAVDELHDTNTGLTQSRVIEHWWDGIGKWKA